MQNSTPPFPFDKFVSYVADRHGYLNHYDISSLSGYEETRLTPVLVRCGAKRFTCAAQYVDDMIEAIEAGGDYVRDVSLPTGSAIGDAVEARIRQDHDL